MEPETGLQQALNFFLSGSTSYLIMPQDCLLAAFWSWLYFRCGSVRTFPDYNLEIKGGSKGDIDKGIISSLNSGFSIS